MRHAAFFGYGSLVNRATHDFAPATPARLAGWRRVWRHTSLRPVAYLSVEPCATTVIEGLVAAVPGGDWAALDEREQAYGRTHLHAASLDHDAHWAASVQVYAVSPHHHAPTARHPVLLSYIDTVVQGFLREFGAEGAARFFATTHGWDAPILDDRAAPRYARHQSLTRAQTALVDESLAGVGTKLLAP